MTYTPAIVSAYFAQQGLPTPQFEVRFHETRRWRWDIAWPDHMIAIEVQGGIWTRGRHSRGTGQIADWEKHNTATTMGWRVYYCQPANLMCEELCDLLNRAIWGTNGAKSTRTPTFEVGPTTKRAKKASKSICNTSKSDVN